MPIEVTAAARTAEVVRIVAAGRNLRVDRVRLDRPRSLRAGAAPVDEVLRLTIEARFEVVDAVLTVFIDGAPAGRLIESPELTSAIAVLPAQLVRDGAAISFGYGETGEQIRVGTLVVAK